MILRYLTTVLVMMFLAGIAIGRRVNFTILAVFLLIFSVLAHNLGYAHPGRTDANGGHYNRKTGEYHKHVKEDSQPDEIDTDPVVNQNTIASDTNESELKLAAWNIRIMSNKSRTDAELMEIARTLADYDFIAIVELRDEAVLKRTQRILLQMGRRMITSSVLRLGAV